MEKTLTKNGKKLISTNQKIPYRNSFKNTFPLNGKITGRITVAAVSPNGRKKLSLLTRKLFSSSRNKVVFQKFDFPVSTNRKKIF